MPVFTMRRCLSHGKRLQCYDPEPSAVLGRIQVETARDPTSHNLWPIEVIIVGCFGLVAGLIGVALARAIQRLTGAR